MQVFEVLLAVSILGLSTILFYYFYFFISIKEKSKSSKKDSALGMSVIICARNEAENLNNHLPYILEQDHPTFEVIVINDRSDDETEQTLKEFARNYEKLKYFTIKNGIEFPGKKNALMTGIKHAKHEYIVVTDADCKPLSRQWLMYYDHNFQENNIVLGYGTYQKRKGVLNAMIRMDTFLIATQYFSFAIKGLPYMGVGRNMGYRKDLFRLSNFDSHLNLKSGDDDLLIQEVANGHNTGICIHNNHHTVSIPETSWNTYWKQKRRHLTTGSKYKPLHKFLLSLFPFALVVFYTFLILLALNEQFILEIITLLIVKITLQIIVYWKISRYLGEKDLVLFSPLLELMSVIYNAFVAASLLFSKKVEWK